MPQVRYTADGYPYYAPDESGDVTAPGSVKTGWPFAAYRPKPEAQQDSGISLKDIAARIGQASEYNPLAILAGYLDKNGTGAKPLDLLFGLGGQPRYQLWPERMIRSATTLPGEVYSGETPIAPPAMRREDITDIPGSAQPIDPVIKRAQDVSALIMSGALGAKKPAVEPRSAADDVIAAVERSPEGLSAKRAETSKSVYPPELVEALKKNEFPLFVGGHMIVPINGEPELEEETPSQKMKNYIERMRRSGGRADPSGPPALTATIVPPAGYRNLMTNATP